MYTVLICDDALEYANYLSTLISKINKERFIIDICGSGKNSINLMNDKVYDWIIVDLNLGDMIGYEVADCYRKINPNGVLCFCSGEFSPVPATFIYTPYRFIDKSQDESEIISYLKSTIEFICKEKAEKYITGYYKGSYQMNNIQIRVQDIMYIGNQKNGRGSVLYLKTDDKRRIDEVMTKEKLTDLYIILKDYGFEYISKRELVNLRSIKNYENNVIEFENGIKMSVARSIKEVFKRRYLMYLINNV